MNFNLSRLFKKVESEPQNLDSKSKEQLIELLYGMIEPSAEQNDGSPTHLSYGVTEQSTDLEESQCPQCKRNKMFKEIKRNTIQTVEIMRNINSKFQDFFSKVSDKKFSPLNFNLERVCESDTSQEAKENLHL